MRNDSLQDDVDHDHSSRILERHANLVLYRVRVLHPDIHGEQAADYAIL